MACDQFGKDIKAEVSGEIKLVKGEARDVCVRFYIEPEYSKPALRVS